MKAWLVLLGFPSPQAPGQLIPAILSPELRKHVTQLLASLRKQYPISVFLVLGPLPEGAHSLTLFFPVWGQEVCGLKLELGIKAEVRAENLRKQKWASPGSHREVVMRELPFSNLPSWKGHKQLSLCPFCFSVLIQERLLTMTINKYPCFYNDFEKHKTNVWLLLGLWLHTYFSFYQTWEKGPWGLIVI